LPESKKQCRGEFKAWRDRLAIKSRRQVIMLGPHSHAFSPSRSIVADDELAFLERAPKHLHLPLTLALWTGQRQGDQLKLTWSAYDGTHIRLKQSKTGARVAIPVGGPLKTALDAAVLCAKSRHSVFVA
jgi:hypothetical protein